MQLRFGIEGFGFYAFAMKIALFLSLIVSLLSVHSVAAPKEQYRMKTLFTCAQERGNEWLEVGIAVNDGWSFKTVIVRHDDFADKLIGFRQAYKTEENGLVIYEDSALSLRVAISEENLTADLYAPQSGGQPIDLKNMTCVKDSEISFDR